MSQSALMEKEWRSIPGWEGCYEACSDGQIRSVRRVLERPHPKNPSKIQSRPYGGKLLTPQMGTTGYLAVNLWQHNKGITKAVHILVCSAFHGRREGRMDVNHKNGCKTDNRSENLEWATRRDNLMHAADVLGVKMVWMHQKERAQQRRMTK